MVLTPGDVKFMGIIHTEGTLETMRDPDMEYKLYPKPAVDIVDALVRLAHGRGGSAVTTEYDWKLVEDLVNFWVQQYPKEAKKFFSSLSGIREAREGNDGYSESKEMQYIASFPQDGKLLRFIKICFPHQQFDKKFMSKFIRRFPKFKIGGY